MKYSLKNDRLEVGFTSLGGALTSIKNEEGAEYLWQGDPEYWSGQAPVLFPICGSLRDNRAATNGGKEIRMPRHGIVRKEEFKLESEKEDSICFSISENEEMLGKYPYPFTLSIEYRLEESSIHVTYGIKNTGTEDMPFFIGGHPAFRCPLLQTEDYGDYQVIFDEKEEKTAPTPDLKTGLVDMGHRKEILFDGTVLPLAHSLFYEDGIIFDRLKSKKVTLCHRENGHGVELEMGSFPYLVIWSAANDGPFLALEPWTGLSTCSDENDVFEEKRNAAIVKPGEEKRLSYIITIL
ncbi:aldose 1-epimerase family protein [Lacrimispora sp. 38-1]|uniref:aldose 1-epimerase family protein n=1 Tax=Lacrimispora sp. 38-1 TaxID=3125778 RepID=UPI003CF0AC35